MNLNDLGYDLLGLGNVVFAAATDTKPIDCVGGFCTLGCNPSCSQCKNGGQNGSQQ